MKHPYITPARQQFSGKPIRAWHVAGIVIVGIVFAFGVCWLEIAFN